MVMLFTKEHLWMRQDEDHWIIGLTPEGLKELGEISYVALPKVGETIDPEAPIFVVESTKAAYDLIFPLSVKIVEINPQLPQRLPFLQETPLDVWFARVEIEDQFDENSPFLTEKDYTLYCRKRKN